MEAQVKADSQLKIVTACAGREFVRYEWRAVPDGLEAEARANPFLDLRPTPTDARRDVPAVTVASVFSRSDDETPPDVIFGETISATYTPPQHAKTGKKGRH